MAPAASPEQLRGRPCGASARRRRAPGAPITTDRTKGESPMPAPADATRMLPAKAQRARRPLALGRTPSSLVTWYLGLTHHWMGDNPRVKTRILLGTHEWIIDRVLAPEVGLAALAADLRPEGALTRSLAALVPPDDAGEWRHFIDLVVANLRPPLHV